MKKFFFLAVTCCLVISGLVFTSCNGPQGASSYQFGYDIDPATKVDERTIAQFELSEDGSIVIYNEMKKTADQYSDAARTCIWKSTKRLSPAPKAPLLPVWLLYVRTTPPSRALSSAST